MAIILRQKPQAPAGSPSPLLGKVLGGSVDARGLCAEAGAVDTAFTMLPTEGLLLPGELWLRRSDFVQRHHGPTPKP